jgi:hypothetical protein
MKRLSEKRYFFNAKGAKNFRKGRKGNNVGDINFAPFGYSELAFAVSLRSLRLTQIVR